MSLPSLGMRPPLPAPSREERAYLLLASLFLGALVMTNAIAAKFFVLFGQPLSCGIIAYPVTFLVTDLISEIFGRRRATQVVKVGFLVSLFVTFVTFVANHAPAHESSPVSQQAFSSVFGFLPGVVLASMVAYLAAQFIDVHLFEFWRRVTRGRHLWLRNNASTTVSQLVDTVLVVTILFVVWPRIDGNPATASTDFLTWRQLIVGGYLFKAGIALLDTPFFYLGTWWLRKWIEGDADTARAS